MIRRPPRSTLFSLHDALPILLRRPAAALGGRQVFPAHPVPRADRARNGSPAGVAPGAVVKDRVPAGQVLTTKWPVLHYGDVPKVDTSTWTFDVSGLVDRPLALTYAELLELPRKVVQCDIHCVTRWSRLDNTFEGVAVQLLLERAGVKPDAHYCLVSAEQGFTTNLPLTDLDRPDNRSEEHTSELQSQSNLVCRLLLEKKNQNFQLSLPAKPGLRAREHGNTC